MLNEKYRIMLSSILALAMVTSLVAFALPAEAKAPMQITVLVKDTAGNPIPNVAVFITQNPVGTVWPGIGGQSPAYITNAEGKVYIPIDPTDTTTFPADPTSTTTFSPWNTDLPIVGVYVYDTVNWHYHMYIFHWNLNNPCVRTVPITHDMSA